MSYQMVFSPFLKADLRSSDSDLYFVATDCDSYRFTPNYIELIVHNDIPKNLNNVSLTLNLCGYLALNVRSKVLWCQQFSNYTLLSIRIAEQPSFALHRIYETLSKRHIANADVRALLMGFDSYFLDANYQDGFLFTHEAFRVQINGTTVETCLRAPLSVQDYRVYLAVHYLAALKIVMEHGFFDREIDLSGLIDSRIGPLDILMANVWHAWASNSGLRENIAKVGKTKYPFDAGVAFNRFADLPETPSINSDHWLFFEERLRFSNAKDRQFSQELEHSIIG